MTPRVGPPNPALAMRDFPMTGTRPVISSAVLYWCGGPLRAGQGHYTVEARCAVKENHRENEKKGNHATARTQSPATKASSGSGRSARSGRSAAPCTPEV